MTIVTPKFGMGASVLRARGPGLHHRRGPLYRRHRSRRRCCTAMCCARRSPRRASRIGSTEAARQAPGVQLVLTGADLAHLGDLRSGVMQKQPDGTRRRPATSRSCAATGVNHVGDAVAFIVADTRALAQDAAELIEVDYERAGCGRRHARRRSTRARRWSGRSSAPTSPSSTRSATQARPTRPSPRRRRSSRIEFVNNRLVCNYMEPRAAIGEWNAGERPLRADHRHAGRARHARRHRQQGVQDRAGASCASSRPDVGGGFGTEGLRLPRISAGAGGGQAARPAGEVDGRPHRAFPRRRAWPRQLGRRPRWRWTRTAASWRCASISSPIWAPTSRNTAPSSRRSASTMSTGVYDIPTARCDRATASTPTPCRSTPIAAPGGRRRPT